MSARSIGLLALSLAVVAFAGCRINSFSISAHDDGYEHHDYDHHPHHAAPVYLSDHHVCGHDCNDHYWNGVSLVALRSGHHHGPSCGHHWSGSRWVVVVERNGNSHHHKSVKFKKHKRRRH